MLAPGHELQKAVVVVLESEDNHLMEGHRMDSARRAVDSLGRMEEAEGISTPLPDSAAFHRPAFVVG
jgi:hypothetical protein